MTALAAVSRPNAPIIRPPLLTVKEMDILHKLTMEFQFSRFALCRGGFETRPYDTT